MKNVTITFLGIDHVYDFLILKGKVCMKIGMCTLPVWGADDNGCLLMMVHVSE